MKTINQYKSEKKQNPNSNNFSKMFRVTYLKLKDHPQLGNIELDLCDDNELRFEGKPYTTVIIGPNGTGKSFILRTIAEIFRQFNEYKISNNNRINLPFGLHIRYYLNGDQYEIISKNLITFKRDGGKLYNYGYYKNRPTNLLEYTEGFLKEIKSDFEIKLEDLVLPTKVLVSTGSIPDRFVFKNSAPEDFYQYLGVRSTNSSSSTKSAVGKTISSLFNSSIKSMDFVINLKDLLIFLGFRESLTINYVTKINKLFFSGNLNSSNFIKYYEAWWESEFTYTNRKKENPIWSIPYYNSNFKNNPKAINELVEYINILINKPSFFKKKPKSSSKIIEIDILSNEVNQNDIAMLTHLENLDIINLKGINFVKDANSLSIEDVSSGEYHLLLSMIRIFSIIKEDSIVLIDEPEISLHPNWQMKYISFLKQVFANFHSCHFILTSHSHFIVSDLEGDSSKVIGLTRGLNQLIEVVPLAKNLNTFGWSAEEVLYSIFNVRSTRNSFLEYDLTKLVTMINRSSNEFSEIKRILKKVSTLVLSENDPLKIIIEKAENYIENYNA
ncbi:MAG: AAA family ATPase [Bacteroidota bacterium]|nr:AAA family ATPase [Bacteroidota bacterium]